MPIYMDYHHFPGVTVEDVKKGHIADKEIEEKFGVKYHQFWINQEADTVFCLIEGPNPKACEEVHQEAHGNVACNIVEVEVGLLEMFMGKQHNVNQGVVYYNDGSLDTGFRFILIVDILVKTDQTNTDNLRQIKIPVTANNRVLETILQHKGQEVKNISDDYIIAVFNEASAAYQCATHVQNSLSKNQDIEFRVGIAQGQPVTESDGFFEDAINYAKQLALLANDGEIVLSKNYSKLLTSKDEIEHANVKIVSETQQEFVQGFFEYTMHNLSNDNYNINTLSKNIGVSRPQLYRKIMALTGRSPVIFLTDIKMHKALSLLKENKYSISEIAYQLGYSNPSYFTKKFKGKYGVLPSKVLVAS